MHIVRGDSLHAAVYEGVPESEGCRGKGVADGGVHSWVVSVRIAFRAGAEAKTLHELTTCRGNKC